MMWNPIKYGLLKLERKGHDVGAYVALWMGGSIFFYALMFKYLSVLSVILMVINTAFLFHTLFSKIERKE